MDDERECPAAQNQKICVKTWSVCKADVYGENQKQLHHGTTKPHLAVMSLLLYGARPGPPVLPVEFRGNAIGPQLQIAHDLSQPKFLSHGGAFTNKRKSSVQSVQSKPVTSKIPDLLRQ
ncbi:unnamed protein product [Dovyalis caffra]|uniref:Uncharacterized protein n=1 Tax=Dovyalis caffra TaxID=77055 RepID=A0AAV1S5E1_9ROSI|nr:unnamed protein product [Dovyalis caffra]